jgi:hypothetical protein
MGNYTDSPIFGNNLPLTAGLRARIQFPNADGFPAKLFRIRNGELTYLNGWKNVQDYMDRVEREAGRDDEDGDAYLLLDVMTGNVIASFKLEAPAVKKEVVAL